MALRIVRKSVGLRPRTFGGGRSAEISSNSASDISVEYRSRMTSYFARSASFQGIANLPKLLQTRENQTPRGRSTNFRSGSQAAGKTRSMKVGDVSYPCRHDSIFGGDIFRDPIRDFDGARTRQAMPAGNRDPAHDAGPSQLTTRTT